MKTKMKVLLVFLCVVICGLSLVACDGGKSTLLGKPKRVVALSYDERTDGEFVAFKNKTQTFAAKFAAFAYDAYQSENNFAVSPISVYMALSLAAECANGDTRAELLSALGVSYEELQKHFPTLYRSLEAEYKRGTKTTGMLNLTNSIWIDNDVSVKQPCIDELSNRYYTHSYSTDFQKDDANKAIRSFIKKQTKGLIDKNFELDRETVFALINTVYLKTIWNEHGDDLALTSTEYEFTSKDGSTTQKHFLKGEYKAGKVYETETYSAFYTSTYHGYKIKFMLPKDGYNVDDIFTADNIAEVNAIQDYNAFDRENNILYSTRCIFPEYKCGYDDDIKSVLKEKFGINKLFINPDENPDGCDFSALTNMPCFCPKVQHVTDLTVDKKGIKGAAVTIIAPGATSPGPTDVQLDFVINKAFGFIIADSQDVALFTGVVNNI